MAAAEVLFVCTANICRSPTAEHLARHHERSERLSFASAGLLRAGERCPAPLVREVARLGVDLSSHRSRRLTTEALSNADLVVTMEVAHLREVAVLERSALAKT